MRRTVVTAHDWIVCGNHLKAKAAVLKSCELVAVAYGAAVSRLNERQEVTFGGCA